MTTQTLYATDSLELPAAPMSQVPPTMQGPVIVAVDGAPGPATLAAAEATARHLRSPIHAIAVLEPVPLVPGADGFSLLPQVYDDELEKRFDANVRAQLTAAWGKRVEWTLAVVTGFPAQVIADEATRRNASLIVMGKGRHATVDRLFGGEITLRVAMLATTPVLAVAPGEGVSPSSVVVGVDFSVASFVAARASIAMLACGLLETCTLTLVHVRPAAPIGNNHWDVEYDAAVAPRLRYLLDLLEPYRPSNMHVRTHIMDGPAVETLLQTMADTSSNMIAVGTRGPHWWERVLVGSTATAVLRRSRHSVLIAPPPRAPERIRLELNLAGKSVIRHSSDWAGALDAFSSRNRGRRARLEIADHARGVPRVQAENYQFVGAAYDRVDRALTIMLSDGTDLTHHMSHTVSKVRSLEIARGDNARDHVLIAEDGEGYCVLTFID